MTILCRVERPRFELTVCGTPDAAWLKWVRTTTVPLTQGQLMWRALANGTPPPPTSSTSSVDDAPRSHRRRRHHDECDQCGKCETCACYCNEPS